LQGMMIFSFGFFICCEHQSVVDAGKSHYVHFDQFHIQSYIINWAFPSFILA
jgi:hypothetical protein